MVLERRRQPLRLAELPEPTPGPGQVQLAVHACGVCRTDLHILDGDLAEPKLPLVMGHQIVGTVRAAGEGAERFAPGDRVGAPWLGWTDGECRYCRSGRENLCDHAKFTGYDLDGGYAEVAVADERFCFPIPEGYPDLQAAPLLCAGLIGYRALRLVGEAERIGFYGFGAAAHILCQVAVHEGLVSAGIHMSDIPAFPYAELWGERSLGSVANLTRRDGEEFTALAPQVPVRTEVEVYPLEEANQALDDLRAGRFRGAAVLQI
jgi:propanol-preferring alcohol dehydrogenase